jgi:DNA polymerase-1
MPRFFLFDAMSLVFRAYYAMSKSGMKSSVTGEQTSAVFGFANMIQSILLKEKPDYACIAFDTAAPTFRHTQYDAYKANRQEFPEPLIPQLLRIKEFITYLNIPQVEKPGYEADDVIGTLAREAAEHDIEVYCVTPDKDYCQLVNDRVKIYRPNMFDSTYDIVDEEKVCEKFGVPPAQVIDILGLIGDSSDNVPGVKGIGEKTAIPLIQQYGTIANLYEHLDEISSKSVRQKLTDNRDMAFLSRELVTIDTHVPVEFHIADYAAAPPDTEALSRFFDTLGFRRLKERFGISPAVATDNTTTTGAISAAEELQAADEQLKTLNDIEHEYILVNSRSKLQSMIDELMSAEMIAFDTETSGLDPMVDDLVGMSLCAREGRAFYIPLYCVEQDFTDMEVPATSAPAATTAGKVQNSLFDEEPVEGQSSRAHNREGAIAVLRELQPLLTNRGIGKCGQNAKFDTLILKRYGIDVHPVSFDTMLASYLLNATDAHNMDALARRWLNYQPIPITALIGEKKKDQRSMCDVEQERICEYACEDADVTLRLYHILRDKLQEENLTELAATVEFPLVDALTQMEYNGVAINTGVLSEISEYISRQSAQLREDVYKETGLEFNLDSPKQLAEVLFEKMGIPPVKKTKTGYSTDVSVLESLAPDHTVASLILEYRHLTKLQSTYVEALPKSINPATGRIHTTFNQTAAGTGRLSSIDPNLQNIPIRTELGRKIRHAFVPQAEGASILSADYSQIELRIMAHVCGDETLIDAFKNNIDIHAATASNLFGLPVDKIDGDMRRVAKTVNFGVMYGLGAFGLAQRLKIPRGQAQDIINNYFDKYPRIKDYIDTTIEQGRSKGYVETLSGRRRYFPDLISNNRAVRTAAERAAINMPIQGTAADMMKLAMINIHREMQKREVQSLMLLQVHDELVFEMMHGEEEDLTAMVKSLMESAMTLGEVPIVVETGVGQSWGEAH